MADSICDRAKADQAHRVKCIEEAANARDAFRLERNIRNAQTLATAIFGLPPNRAIYEDNNLWVAYAKENLSFLYAPENPGTDYGRAYLALVKEQCLECGEPIGAGNDGYTREIRSWDDFLTAMFEDGVNPRWHQEDCSHHPDHRTPAPVEAPCCGNCQYFKELARPNECRRHVPTVYFVDYGIRDDRGPDTQWPRVAPGDWCGEHEWVKSKRPHPIEEA